MQHGIYPQDLADELKREAGKNMNDIFYPPSMTFWQALQTGRVDVFTSEKYLDFVRGLPCVITGGKAEAHHLVGHGLKPVGGKVNDLLTFPLAPRMHRPEYAGSLHHLSGAVWEKEHGDQRIYVMQTLVEAVLRGVLRVAK